MNELKSLGRYRIKGVLGKGAMGLVYDGLDPTLDRRVAIKTILTSALDEVADSLTTHQALEELDEATLQLFWRDWPRIQSWAGSLWRQLQDEMAERAGPAGGDVDTGGGD